MPRPSTRYGDDLAFVHHAGFGEHAQRAGTALLRRLRRAGILGGTLVDLGCGSGIWARMASEAGFDFVRVDASPAMIRLARRVAPRARFVRASLHEFELPFCEAVTILGEGLNYLAPRGERARPSSVLFHRAVRALRRGGLIAFDALVDGTEPLDARSWRTGPDWAVLVDTREHPARRLVERRITSFRRIGRRYRRCEELHRVRVLERDRLVLELEAAGFDVTTAARYGDFALLPRRLAFFGRCVRGR